MISFRPGRAAAALALVLCLGLAGCPRDKDPIVPDSAKAPVKEKLRQLDTLFEVLQKDNPPAPDTYPYRQMLADAEKALAAGRLDEASTKAQQVDQWITEARKKYYRDHETAIMSGAAKETPDALMGSANNFVRMAQDRKTSGDAWASDQYFQAAIEQGELALLSAQRTPEQAAALVKLAPQMTAIYVAAGKNEQAAAVQDRVVQWLVRSIGDVDKEILDCIKGRAAGCTDDDLGNDKDKDKTQEKYLAKEQELRKKNDLRNSIAAAGEGLAPDKIKVYDWGKSIDGFHDHGEAIYNPKFVVKPHTPPGPETDSNAEQMCKEAKTWSDKNRPGATSAAAAGITLEETGILIAGEAIVIKGKLTNVKTRPIYYPRVTVVGNCVLTELKNLGSPRMDPMNSATFQLTVKYLTPEAFEKGASRLPAHEMLLIYRDQPTGQEIKVVQTMQ